MKKLVLALVAASLASSAFAMGTRPGTVAEGSDTIARADFDTMNARYACALPKFTKRQGAIKALFNGYHSVAVEAYTKHNAEQFNGNYALMAKVISDLALPC